MTSDPVIAWLLATDPAIAWQVQRDLLDASEDVWRPLRSRVEHEGWGARLLAHQDSDGQWAGGAFFPHDFSRELWEAEGQPWTATTYALTDLREWGLDPTSETARRTADLVGRNSRWDHDGQSYWAGEVEECINGRTLADGAYFGADVTGIADRLLTEQQPDGGWNCERAEGSTRGSFHSTINVLEGLLEFEKATERADVASARHTGEEFLLSRSLFRRLTDGEIADQDFLKLTHPNRWHYDVLRGLDYLRAAGFHDGAGPDPRLGEALGWLRGKADDDGRWPLESRPGGRVWFDVDDGIGMPSAWLTLRARRVLRWADGAGRGGA